MVRAWKKWALIPVLTFIAACSGDWRTDYDVTVPADVSKSWRVNHVAVVVPDALTVNNDNTLAPNGDIVWHGEPFGDRKEQVKLIFEDGVVQGSASLKGSRPVQLNVVVQQFHAVTPSAVTQSPGAVHNITYQFSVVDTRTGKTLAEPQIIKADLEAFVGAAAITAAIQGQDQRTRIVEHLKQVTEGVLGVGPDPRRSFSSIGR